jgi:hypothetical protein
MMAPPSPRSIVLAGPWHTPPSGKSTSTCQFHKVRDNSGGRNLILVLLPDFLGCLDKVRVFKKLLQTALYRQRIGFLWKMHKPNTTVLNGPGIPVLVGHVRHY